MRAVLALSLLFFTLFVPYTKAQIATAVPGCMDNSAMTFNGVECDGGSSWFFGINGAGDVQCNGIDGEICCPPSGTDGDNMGHFTFEEIDISSYTNVSITMDYEGQLVGGHPNYEDDSPINPLFGCMGSTFGGHDQVLFAYILDGTEFASDYIHGTSEADFTGTWNVTGLSGNTLTVKVYVKMRAGDEHVYFRNLVIDGDPGPISAGPDDMACNGSPFNLSGSGTGTWSGGLGVFGDPNDPLTTYTPDASEDNSTVTLTYTDDPTTPACGSIFPPPSDDVNLTLSGPTATMAYADPNFDGQFCSGDCQVVNFAISGGDPLYTLNLLLDVGLVNAPIPVPGFDVNDVITICYDPAQTLPNFDPASNTITVPNLANGSSGSLDLNSITDDNGCTTPLSESVMASFTTTPTMTNATLQECSDAFGFATFNLDDALPQLDVMPSGLTVEFYEDMAMSTIAPNPYTTTGATIYAFATDGACTSDPTEVNLISLPTGDVGVVELYCDAANNSTMCTLCDQDGNGETVTLTIVLDDPLSTYDIELVSTPGGTDLYTLAGGTQTINIPVTGSTQFEIISIIQDGLCPDDTDLGGIVTIDLTTPPMLSPVNPLSSCDNSITLPPILGNNLSSARYYTEENGQGTAYQPGDVLTMTDTLYIYDGVPGCDDQVEVIVSIGSATTYSAPADVSRCGSYTLPAISGSGVGSTAAYYTGMNGTGTSFIPGDILTTSTMLFIYDPNSDCQTNQPAFNVTITNGVSVEPKNDTIACEAFIFPPIEPADLLAGEAYYSEIGGTGLRIQIGDTLTLDSIYNWVDTNAVKIYMYYNDNGCESQDSFWVNIEKQYYPGMDASIAYCEGSDVIIDLNQIIGDADTSGLWISLGGPSVGDGSMVNVADYTMDSYTFSYGIKADSVCRDTSARVFMDITSGADAGNGLTLTACESDSDVDVTNYVVGGTSGGIWVAQTGSGIDVSNPNSVDLSIANLDRFDIYYILSATADCPADTATVDVRLIETPDAGADNMSNVCAGASVDLLTLITGQSSTGFLVEAVPSGSLAGTIVNTNGLLGSYTYYYIVSSPVCRADTATLVLEISNTVDAGPDVNMEICDVESPLFLSSLISGDAGGTFYQVGGSSVPNEIFPIDYGNDLNFIYVVGDGATCPLDTASITLNPVDIDLSIGFNIQGICPNRSRIMNITYNADRDYTIYFSTTNRNSGGTTYFDRVLEASVTSVAVFIKNNPNGKEDGNDLEPDESYTIRVDSIVANDGSGCTFLPSQSFNVQTIEELTYEVDTTLCPGEFIEVNGEQFTSDTMFMFPTTFGCDSIVDLKIDYYRADTLFVDETICDGSTRLFGGTTFDENMPNGTIVIGSGAASGCDSVIVVNLIYSDQNEVLIDDAICGNESVTVGGTVYDASNPTGTFTVMGMGGDCDTVYTIDLQVGATARDTIRDQLCTGSTLDVGGEIFSSDRPSGEVALQTEAGCDSIITVDLTFADNNIINVNDQVCPGDTVRVAGTAYFIGNSTGSEMVTGIGTDCDTVFQVALIEAQPSEGMLELFACDQSETFTVGGMVFDINNTSGTVTVGSNLAGCDSLVNVQVFFDQLGGELTYRDPQCEDDIGFVTVESVSSTNLPLTIMVNGDSFTTSTLPLEFALSGNSIALSIMDANGCELSIDTTLEIKKPDIEATASVTADGTQLGVSSTAAVDRVVWSPSEGLSCVVCDNPIATPEMTTTYTAEVFYAGQNCSELVEVTVRVDEGGLLSLPNIISIDGNSANSTFYVKAESNMNLRVGLMLIYDRWGNLVFEARDVPINDAAYGWAGNFGGKAVVAGVYTYYVELSSDIEGVLPIVRKGDLTVFY